MPQTKVSKYVQDKTVKDIRKDWQEAMKDFTELSSDEYNNSFDELHALYRVQVLSQELIKWIVM